MNPTPMIIRIGTGTHRCHRSPFNPSSCDSVRKRVVRMPSRARASHRSGRTCCWVFIFLVVSGREILADHPLPAGLIRLHDAMRFADLLEAKHAGRLGLEPARRHLLRNFLQRHVGQREARRAEHKTTEEREVDTTRHLQQRVEVLDRREPPRQPARHARPPRRSMARESRMVLLPTRSSTASSCLASAMRWERSGPSNSTREAPSFCTIANRCWLRVVAMIRAPALTAILSAAWPNDEVAPRITSVWSLVISRLRKRQVHAVA